MTFLRHSATALLLAGLALCGVAAAGPHAVAVPALRFQDTPAEPAPFEPPSTPEEAVAVDAATLEAALEGRGLPELERWLATWVGFVQARAAAYASAAAAEPGSEEHAAGERLGTDRDTLVSQAEAVMAAVVAAGGDASAARATLESIHEAELRELDDLSTVPADMAQASTLELELLEASVRPLTKEQVEEQLALWLQLLQEKCIAVRRVEVSAYLSEDAAEVAKYNERAVELRAERDRLIKRVRVVIDALEEKNGDVADARAYVHSVVVAPPVSGWRAAWTIARAWVRSPEGGVDLGLRLARALGVLVLAWLLARVIGLIVDRAMRSIRSASDLLREFVHGAVRKAVVFVGFLFAAHLLGIEMGPLLALIGAAGLVIGLALQGTLSNLASGLLIMLYRPFDVGHLIEAAGAKGKVEGLTLMTTRIKTVDNQSIYIPNNQVWGDVITNLNENETRRVDLLFGIGYDEDVDRAREVLGELVRGHELVLEEPEPIVEVHALNESSVDFVVRPWAKTEDYWTVYWDLTRAVKKRFDEEGICIPYPQRDVHVHHVPAAEGAALPAEPNGGS